MPAVEITRFRTKPGRAEEVIAARPAMIASFRDDRVGFIRADLVRLGDDEWVDFVVWESREAFDQSRAIGTTPAVQPFFDLISEAISQELGELTD